MNRHDTPLDHGPVRLRLAAVAGVVGLAAMAVRILLSGSFDEEHPASALAWAGAHPGLALVVNLTETLGFGLIAFACITLTGLVRGRGRWLTQIGGWGTAISWLVIAFNGIGAVISALGDYPDRSAAAEVVRHFQHSPQTLVILIPLITSALWPLLFGLGLCRARLVGWWYAALVVVWLALEAAVNASGLTGLLSNGLPTALVVGVWVKLLLDRASSVAEAPASAEALADAAAQ